MNKDTKMKWLQKFIAILMLLVVLLPIASAINYPQLTGYVTDNANIIDANYKQKITDLAEKINKETTVEIAVLTVDSLEGDSPENYAVQTFRQNGVGKKDNNNGLLILVAKNDRKYRFEVGYGLEGTIPDAMKVPIGDKIITPNFRNGDYGKGIYESMLAIEGLVTNNTEVLSKYGLINSNLNTGSGGEDAGGVLILMLFIFFVIIALVFLSTIRGSMRNSGTYSPPSIPTTYKPPPYTRSSDYKSTSSSSSSSHRRSSHTSYPSGSHSHNYSSGSHSFGGGFGGFGGGRSGGGGFGGGW